MDRVDRDRRSTLRQRPATPGAAPHPSPLQPHVGDGLPENPRRRFPDPSTAVYLIILTAALFSFLFFQTHSHGQKVHILPNQVGHTPNPAIHVSDLAHLLHPGEHADRAPANVKLTWQITTGIRSPDGVEKKVYLINDAFPGPLIEARSGDVVDIEVVNGLQDEGVSLHFHGLHMKGYNEMDGAIGVTQDPIQPGGRMTYHFQIHNDQSGTFWYHAHDHVQRGDGLFGAFIVHQPAAALDVLPETLTQYDEERVMMVGDWYHKSAKDGLAWYMRAGSFGMEPVPDSMLINGLGAFNCSNAVRARPLRCSQIEGSGLPAATFDSKKRYRLRIINTGTFAGVSVTVPGASFTPMEVDGGHPVTGQTASSIGVIHPGQRVDLTLSFTSATPPNSIQFELDAQGFRYPNPALTAAQLFPLLLSNVNSDATQLEVAPHYDLADLKSRHNLSPNTVPLKADRTIILYVTTMKLAKLSNVPHGFINYTTWEPQSPPLISLARSRYNSHQLVPSISYQSPALWIDIILNNIDEDDHPFHLHGHAAYVLQSYSAGYGWGSWNPAEDSEPPGGPLNLADPVVRDTFLVPMRGYVVLRFRADNPGLWMLHCHALWHQASGMAMTLEVGDNEKDI